MVELALLNGCRGAIKRGVHLQSLCRLASENHGVSHTGLLRSPSIYIERITPIAHISILDNLDHHDFLAVVRCCVRAVYIIITDPTRRTNCAQGKGVSYISNRANMVKPVQIIWIRNLHVCPERSRSEQNRNLSHDLVCPMSGTIL